MSEHIEYTYIFFSFDRAQLESWATGILIISRFHFVARAAYAMPDIVSVNTPSIYGRREVYFIFTHRTWCHLRRGSTPNKITWVQQRQDHRGHESARERMLSITLASVRFAAPGLAQRALSGKFAFISVFSTIYQAKIELEVALGYLTPQV